MLRVLMMYLITDRLISMSSFLGRGWRENWSIKKGGEGISREERERGALAGSPFQNEKIGISKF